MERLLTHEEADNLAQRVLGDFEPYPGESYDSYQARMAEATRRFEEAHPNWRNKK